MASRDGRRAWLLLAAVGLGGLLWPLRAIYLTRAQIFQWEHPLTINQTWIAFDAFLRREIPLWTDELNGGQPVWPILEVQMPVYDPVTLLVGFPLVAWGLELHDAYAWVLAVWLAAFLWGLWLLARRLRLDRARALFVALAALAGLVYSLPFVPYPLTHIRYFPYAALAGLAFLRRPSSGRAAALGAALGLSASGVHTAYLMGFLLLLAALLAAFRFPARLAGKGILVPLGVLIGVLLLAWLPVGVAARYFCAEGVAANRAALPYVWWAQLREYLELLSWQNRWNYGSGHVFIGYVGGSSRSWAWRPAPQAPGTLPAASVSSGPRRGSGRRPGSCSPWRPSAGWPP